MGGDSRLYFPLHRLKAFRRADVLDVFCGRIGVYGAPIFDPIVDKIPLEVAFFRFGEIVERRFFKEEKPRVDLVRVPAAPLVALEIYFRHAVAAVRDDEVAVVRVAVGVRKKGDLRPLFAVKGEHGGNVYVEHRVARADEQGILEKIFGVKERPARTQRLGLDQIEDFDAEAAPSPK